MEAGGVSTDGDVDDDVRELLGGFGFEILYAHSGVASEAGAGVSMTGSRKTSSETAVDAG